MKRILSFAACLALLTTTLSAQTQRLEPTKDYQFTVVKELPITPVKDQASSGTCWCYSTISFIESEILRMGGPDVDLAEMFEPDMEAESIEVTNIIKYDSYE